MPSIIRDGSSNLVVAERRFPRVSALGATGTAASANWWEAGGATGCLGAWRAKGAASLAASKVNLANPGTNDLTNYGIGAPAFNGATGWTMSGAGEALNTGISPAANYTAIIQFANVSNTSKALFGVYFSFLCMYSVGSKVRYLNDNAESSVSDVAPDMSAGNLCIAGSKGYRDGVEEATGLPNNVVTAETIIIGGINDANDGTCYNGMTGDVIGFALYNNMLNGTKVAGVAAAMAAL